MHVNRSPFLYVISKDLKFRTTSFLSSKTKESLKDTLSKVIVVYRKGGFVMKYINRDGQFKCLKNIIHDIDIDIYNVEDHVNVVERSIQTVEQIIRCMVQSLPFRRLTRVMVRRLATAATRNLNQFPVDEGI